MSMIKADPRKSRQLPVKGPLLLWRSGQDGVSREGLVVVVNACVNPECPCREVTLEAYRVGDGLIGVELKGELVRFSFLKDSQGREGETGNSRVLFAKLDMDTGRVEIAKDVAENERDESGLAWLREELDGALLDHISDQVLRQKGLLPCARMEVTHFDRGQMVAFGETYVYGRIDVYVIDGQRLEVLDVYCVDPGCACTEMRFAVQSGQREVGHVIVDLAKPDLTRFEGPTLLRSLWQALRRRYPSMDVFRKRESMMKAAGPDIIARVEAAHRAAQPAISRNQPCPCGSGKKYKRCCIRKTVQPSSI